MYKFSETSIKNLEEAHPDLQLLFKTVIKFYDCSVIEGHRGEEEQNRAYYKGHSKLKFPKSKHNKTPAMAVDVMPYPKDWKNTKRFYHFGGFVMAIADMLKERGLMEHTVRWGGDWDSDNDLDDQSFMDLVHFELI